jgi:hypothetical protein
MSQQSSECLRLITEPFEANNAAAAVENAVDTGYIPGGVQIPAKLKFFLQMNLFYI